MEDIKRDVREIKETTIELLKQSAVHNELLREHERRSIALEQSVNLTRNEMNTRLRPIETHVSVVSKVLGFTAAVILAVLVQIIIRKFL